ncbi:MAG: hypothetical protein Q8T09_01290 [Candidatus Melainabacteria bacterium]|nr:hypothetical protein [Candidatus Melainabacteria bacterium]
MFRAINTTIILVLCLASIRPADAADANSNKSSKGNTDNRNNESIKGIAPTSVKAASGVVYQLFPQEKFAIEFRTKRPSKADNDIVFCIPAAFTGHDNKIDGVFICNGAIGNGNAINHELGGAMVIKNGQGQLLSTNKGATLTQQFLESVQKAKGSLFQQFLIVHNGSPAVFRDQSKFQRRAIGLTKQGTFKIFESDKAITFSTFNNDLATLGATEALYFDMGAWDEGWYRHATTGKTITIGLDKSQTHRQSNWLVLKK